MRINTISFAIYLSIAVVCVDYGAMAQETGKQATMNEMIEGSQGGYTFMWWARGWRGGRGERLRCIQTNTYGMAMDTHKMTMPHFGPIREAQPYNEAVAQSNSVITSLPAAEMDLKIKVGNTTYTCRRGGNPRLIASGRWLQRADVLDLIFEDEQGNPLPADCRLEIFAWPDRLSLMLDIVPKRSLKHASASIRVNTIERTTSLSNWSKGENQKLSAVVFDTDPHKPVARLKAWDMSNQKALSVIADEGAGWMKVEIPVLEGYQPGDKSSLQRFLVEIANPSAKPENLRINFALEGTVPGITGLLPMLRDREGNPMPIPVQISKNWHRKKGVTFLYEGPWAHCLTSLNLPAGFEGSLEFCIVRNFWGKLPLASHAQLSLIGWSNSKAQLWDQVALGSWGESICYDPDVTLGRSMIDDVRPLMVTTKNTKGEKWGWTNNVGGGDFLVYVDSENRRQPLVRMRTAYLRYGPNLTDVVYAGVSADHAIEARLRVQTPRSDDIHRSYHTIRYDVLKPVEFKRLAFYQLGADKYNNHQFNKIAVGDATGLSKEWVPVRGGKKYHVRNIVTPGAMPWFSLHQGVTNKKSSGAWANRGLVLRSWRARINGKSVKPTFASFGTTNGPESANVELVPPAGVTKLKAGDYVEATVELLVLPQFAKDYYGPNRALLDDLTKNQNTWKPVFRQAKKGAIDISVSKGKLLRSYPVEIEVDSSQQAELTVTGGVAYAPITFMGLDRHTDWVLESKVQGTWKAIDQSVYGNDFWQTTAIEGSPYSLTFNVLLDADAGLQHFRLVQRKK